MVVCPWTGGGTGPAGRRRSGPATRALGLALTVLFGVLPACSTGALADGNASSGSSADRSSPGSTSPDSPATAPATPPGTAGATGAAPEPRVVPLPAGLAPEASGIIRSAGDPGVFFLVDDATGPAALDAVRISPEGARRAGRWLIDELRVGNPEALTSGSCGPDGAAGSTCLYLGDIGQAERDDISVLRFAEPAASDDPGLSGTAENPAVLVAAERVRFTYPGSPEDAEAMAIDTDGSVLILSKPAKPPRGEPGEPVRLYRGAPGGGVLSLAAEFRLPAPERPRQSRLVGVRPTDMALDGGRVLLLTYDQVLEYRRPVPAAPWADFPTWPVRELASPSLPQAEGIAGTGDGCGFVVASEAGPGGSTGSLAVVAC